MTRWQRRSATRWRCTGRCAADGIEFRFHQTILYNSIYLGDDQLLVNTHVFGLSAAAAPVWHLRKVAGGEIVSTYLESFERVWETGSPGAGGSSDARGSTSTTTRPRRRRTASCRRSMSRYSTRRGSCC